MRTSSIKGSSALSDAEHSIVLLGPSKATSQLCLQVHRLAPHLRTALLSGEQNCGQEAIARLLLRFSSRPHRLFVKLPAAEADLRLGGADPSRGLPPDVFLFLPDADRLSMIAQQHIVRLLKQRHSDRVSIVAATTEDLRTLVGMGRYFPELADALGSIRIRVPALKDRPEDIPMLLDQTIHLRCQAKGRTVPKISGPFLQAAMQHEWSGNFGELSAVAGYLLDKEPSSAVLDLPEWTRAINANMPEPYTNRMVDLATVVHQHINAVLQSCGGNKANASKILGVSRSTLYRLTDAARRQSSLQLMN